MADSNTNEKNFNDEELADIMSEIESLESELVEDDDLSEVVSMEAEDNVKEVVSMAKREEIREVEVEKVKSLPAKNIKSNNDTSLSFDVHGDMRFNLGFVINGKSLSIYVDEESNGLVVEMEGGVKLNVPFSGSKAA